MNSSRSSLFRFLLSFFCASFCSDIASIFSSRVGNISRFFGNSWRKSIRANTRFIIKKMLIYKFEDKFRIITSGDTKRLYTIEADRVTDNMKNVVKKSRFNS